jgi:ATP-dependent DNA helicase RecQ
VLRGEQAVMLARAGLARAARGKGARGRPRASGAQATPSPAARDLDEAATERYARLRIWRLDTAKAHGVPPYVIFHDAHLAEIARQAPATLAALGRIPGVGATKLERYGADLLAALDGLL